MTKTTRTTLTTLTLVVSLLLAGPAAAQTLRPSGHGPDNGSVTKMKVDWAPIPVIQLTWKLKLSDAKRGAIADIARRYFSARDALRAKADDCRIKLDQLNAKGKADGPRAKRLAKKIARLDRATQAKLVKSRVSAAAQLDAAQKRQVVQLWVQTAR